jgi:hypothetical protein
MNKQKRDKGWMRNKAQLKNPKVFQVTMVRNPNGSFHLIGGETKVLERKNQHTASWVNVDTRDFATELRNSRINSL